VQSVDPVNHLDNGVSTVGFQTGDNGTGEGSRALVDSLRTDRAPFDAKVVGQASGIVDFRATVAERALWAIGLVVLATLVLLFLMTGSVVIPVKALVMNVLSLGAALGVTVWIFEDGHLENLLRFASAGAVENTIPLLVLAFGFGLSMDYEVFLLSRIVELHEQGHDTREAVTLGLQRSGRIITSAALLMVIVFAGFAAGDLLVMKEMGTALVLAIIIDATLVRMLLVPATMSVLGSVNWWAPAPLRRLHERWGITELAQFACCTAPPTSSTPPGVIPSPSWTWAPASSLRRMPWAHRATARSPSTVALTTGCRGPRRSARHPGWRPCSTTRPCGRG
jgi:RND superfamily putative drug exporter